MGLGREEWLSGAGWDPGWEAETLQQSWIVGTSAFCDHGLHIPRTLQGILELAKPKILVKVQTLLGQLHFFLLLCTPARQGARQ